MKIRMMDYSEHGLFQNKAGLLESFMLVYARRYVTKKSEGSSII